MVKFISKKLLHSVVWLRLILHILKLNVEFIFLFSVAHG